MFIIYIIIIIINVNNNVHLINIKSSCVLFPLDNSDNVYLYKQSAYIHTYIH